jgi:hypothetical protein
MRPSRRKLPEALLLALLAASGMVRPAHAQYYDPALRSLDLASDVARSPRLLGMGGLSLVVPDRYLQYNAWYLGGNPLGIHAADSSSTLDIRPESGSASGLHNQLDHLREDLAGRANYFGMESFYRDTSGNAFGATGELKSVRTDVPYSASLETRHAVSFPYFSPAANGVFPYFGKGKLRYALRMQFGGEHVLDQYRTFIVNDAGQFLSKNGTTVTPPDLFKPDDVKAHNRGAGGGFSYPIGHSSQLAIMGDLLTQQIVGVNTGTRYSSEISEKRPYGIGQATLVGHVGKSLEYALDGHTWNARSQQDWRFSISAGTGSVPLLGRGKLLVRHEKGTSSLARARWTAGSLILAGQAWTRMTDVFNDPPATADPTSFNSFLYQIYARQGADSLALPDSIVANEERDHAWGMGGGASWKLHRSLVGVEYHWSRDALSQSAGSAGPIRKGWDVRGGLEHHCSDIITGRVGAGYQWYDADDLTRNNEYKGWSGSLGMGVHPVGTTWSVELGWSLTWLRSDYGDPTDSRSSRQQLASVLRWAF